LDHRCSDAGHGVSAALACALRLDGQFELGLSLARPADRRLHWRLRRQQPSVRYPPKPGEHHWPSSRLRGSLAGYVLASPLAGTAAGLANFLPLAAFPGRIAVNWGG